MAEQKTEASALQARLCNVLVIHQVNHLLKEQIQWVNDRNWLKPVFSMNVQNLF